MGFGFVEEEEVDVGGAEGSEAAVKGDFGFGCGEARFLVGACGGAGGLGALPPNSHVKKPTIPPPADGVRQA